MDVMAQAPKKINTKIAYVCRRDGVGPSELARIAGVTPASSGQYLKDSMPSAVALARIADHFKLSMQWFLNDDAAIDRPQTNAQQLSDHELMDEFARRYLTAAMEADEIIERCRTVDWQDVALHLFSAGFKQDESPQGQELIIRLLNDHQGPFAKINTIYSLSQWVWTNAQRLGVPHDKAHALTPEQIRERYRKLVQQHPMMQWVAIFNSLQMSFAFYPPDDPLLAQVQEKIISKIKRAEPPTGDPSSPAFIDNLLAS